MQKDDAACQPVANLYGSNFDGRNFAGHYAMGMRRARVWVSEDSQTDMLPNGPNTQGRTPKVVRLGGIGFA